MTENEQDQNANPNPQSDAPMVYTIQQTAEILQLSDETVRRLIKKGELPHVRIGSSIRIHRGDVEHFLEEHRTTEWEKVDNRGPRQHTPQERSTGVNHWARLAKARKSRQTGTPDDGGVA
jgi:excisionase family DNA binding protein